MAENHLAVGDKVTVIYKTGRYVAELVEQGNDKTLVKIVAVLRHPTQGDLHSPGRVDVAFQQRRALALNEKTWVHPASVKLFEGQVPDYKESLQEALEDEISKLKKRDDAWGERSIEQLEDLKKDYKLV